MDYPITTVHLVRHGDVENPESVYYGRLPGFSLSEEGQEQASAAGSHLKHRAISTIYASPQTRAQETARIIQASVDATPHFITEPALNEILSQYDGCGQDEMERLNWNFYRGAGEGYEQPADILARVRQFINRARLEHEGEEIVAVSHADPIVFFWMWVLDIPLEAENRRLLDRFGLSDDYPAKASISSFLFVSRQDDERPTYSYLRPY